MDILKLIANARIASAVVYPTSAYKGGLPNKTVRKGSKGSDVKAVQTFLNWCIKSGLAVDGVCGTKTVKAIKKFQKQYKLKADGIFGTKSKAKAKSIIAKHAPKPVPTPSQTWVDKANAWAKKIADDNSWHYVKWSSNSKTHECPICKKHPVGAYHGWNCIGFAFAYWHHGGGLKCTCNCHVIDNAFGTKLLKMDKTKALKELKKKIGLTDIDLIRNGGKNIPQSQMKPGDLCLCYTNGKYYHIYPYIGNGYMIDCGSWKDKAKQIAKRKANPCKVIIRYTGK